MAAVVCTGLLLTGIYAAFCILPIASQGPLRDFALSNNSQLREEIGWDELVAQVASIRDALPVEQRENLGIAVGNYGEYGAIAMLGPQYQLPMPVTTVNSGWLRGYPETTPAAFIVLGNTEKRANELFMDCRVAGRSSNALGVDTEENSHRPDILVCGRPRRPLSEVWRQGPDFG